MSEQASTDQQVKHLEGGQTKLERRLSIDRLWKKKTEGVVTFAFPIGGFRNEKSCDTSTYYRPAKSMPGDSHSRKTAPFVHSVLSSFLRFSFCLSWFKIRLSTHHIHWATLLPFFQRHIEPGSIICSDQWAANNRMIVVQTLHEQPCWMHVRILQKDVQSCGQCAQHIARRASWWVHVMVWENTFIVAFAFNKISRYLAILLNTCVCCEL